MELSFDDIKNLIDSSKATSAKSNGPRNEVKLGWLPEGTHKIRFFVDSERNMMRTFSYHKIDNKKFLCPNFLKSIPPSHYKVHGFMNEDEFKAMTAELPSKCECCNINREINNFRLGLGSKFSGMIYGHLIETSAPDAKWWVPGTVYAIVTSGRKFKTAFDSMMESLAADSPEFLISAFNPEIKGGMFTVKYTRDKKNSEISIQPVIGRMADPVPGLNDKTWVPLHSVYLSSHFNKANYEHAVEFAKKKQLEHAQWKLNQQRTGSSTDPNQVNEQVEESSEEMTMDQVVTQSQTTQTTENVSQVSQATETSQPTTQSTQVTQQVQQPESVAPVPTPSSQPTHSPAPSPQPTPEANVVQFKAKKEGDAQDDCFGNFTDSNMECMTCDMNIECMSKKYG